MQSERSPLEALADRLSSLGCTQEQVERHIANAQRIAEQKAKRSPPPPKKLEPTLFKPLPPHVIAHAREHLRYDAVAGALVWRTANHYHRAGQHLDTDAYVTLAATPVSVKRLIARRQEWDAELKPTRIRLNGSRDKLRLKVEGISLCQT